MTEHLKHIWFSLMLTLWCLEQKRGAPKAIIAFGHLFKGIFPLSPRGTNLFVKNFFIKVSHFMTEHLEHIWFSLMLTFHIGVTFYKENSMDIVPTFVVRGKIEPNCLRGLLKKRLLLSGDSKSLALLGYCYTIEGHHLILHWQTWWTLPLKSKLSKMLNIICKYNLILYEIWFNNYVYLTM